jgi:hypothetical protein
MTGSHVPPGAQVQKPRALVLVEKVGLVPDLDDPIGVGANTEFIEDLTHVFGLRCSISMGDVPHVEQDVGPT